MGNVDIKFNTSRLTSTCLKNVCTRIVRVDENSNNSVPTAMRKLIRQFSTVQNIIWPLRITQCSPTYVNLFGMYTRYA